MYKPSDAYYKEFTTANPSTGAAANADSTPSATANHNGSDDGTFALTVTNLDTGRYTITGTVPAEYNKGDVVNVTVAATCSSIAGKACVDTFTIDSKRIGDLNDIAATAIVSNGAITTSSGGVVLCAAGLDGITVETVNARQALNLILDAVASLLSGATGSSGTITIKDPTGVYNRIVASVDANGNRTAITLTPPG